MLTKAERRGYFSNLYKTDRKKYFKEINEYHNNKITKEKEFIKEEIRSSIFDLLNVIPSYNPKKRKRLIQLWEEIKLL